MLFTAPGSCSQSGCLAVQPRTREDVVSKGMDVPIPAQAPPIRAMGHAPIVGDEAILIFAVVLQAATMRFRPQVSREPSRCFDCEALQIRDPPERRAICANFASSYLFIKRGPSFSRAIKVSFGWLFCPCPLQSRPRRGAVTSRRDRNVRQNAVTGQHPRDRNGNGPTSGPNARSHVHRLHRR